MKKKSIYMICGMVAALACIVCIVVACTGKQEAVDEETALAEKLSGLKQFITMDIDPETTAQTEETGSTTDDETTEETAFVTEPASADTAIETETETTEPPRRELWKPVDRNNDNLLDFDILHECNPDIYAWIEIGDSKVNDPILQNSYNDQKYLKTAYDGSAYAGGAIFTESAYNAKDFNDPVTMIYGHWVPSGKLFGSLQTMYSNAETFSQYQDIKIYLPGEVRHYTVFAAVPFDTSHILAAYDFTNDYWYKSFFKRIKDIRSLEANFDETYFPEYGDKVIILSTCLNGDSSNRYLVMAVLREDS